MLAYFHNLQIASNMGILSSAADILTKVSFCFNAFIVYLLQYCQSHPLLSFSKSKHDQFMISTSQPFTFCMNIYAWKILYSGHQLLYWFEICLRDDLSFEHGSIFGNLPNSPWSKTRISSGDFTQCRVKSPSDIQDSSRGFYSNQKLWNLKYRGNIFCEIGSHANVICPVVSFSSVHKSRRQNADPFMACQRTVITVAVKDNRNKHTKSLPPSLNILLNQLWCQMIYHQLKKAKAISTFLPVEKLIWSKMK